MEMVSVTVEVDPVEPALVVGDDTAEVVPEDGGVDVDSLAGEAELTELT